jgi:hypothetical protein
MEKTWIVTKLENEKNLDNGEELEHRQKSQTMKTKLDSENKLEN